MTINSVLSSPLGPSTGEKDAEILQFIEEITKIADVVQQSVLNEILTLNFQIEYRQNFKSNIRIVTYEDLQVKIQHTKYDADPVPSQRRLAATPRKIREKWDYRRK
uniref:Auxin and ethylene responsive GH3 n=1 Tax=Solanum tuberosum TaxID=4113 RepID=M1CFP7_SOLTU